MAASSLTLFIILLFISFANSSYIEINPDGGLKKIVIAVSQRVMNENMINLRELKTLLTDFFEEVSKGIFNATRNQFFLSEIQVLLPRSWLNTSGVAVNLSTFESFQEADIRLDSFNPSPEKDDLYTHQSRGCGERGDFIYSNPRLLIEWNSTRNEIIVNSFVEEWLKFRYGIVDEMESQLKSTLCELKSKWEVMQISEDFKNYQTVNKKEVNKIGSLKLNFVRKFLRLAIVVDSLLFNDDFPLKNSNLPALSVKKLWMFSSLVNGRNQKGCLLSDKTKLTCIDLLSTNDNIVGAYVQSLKHQNITKRNVSDAIRRTLYNMQDGNDIHPVLILLCYGPNVSSEIYSTIFSRLNELKFFLYTWTPVEEESSLSKNIMKNFVKHKKRSLWVNINVQPNANNCNLDTRIQVEDALNLFYYKFMHDDFYSGKVKIQDSIEKPKQNMQFILPDVDSTLNFNIFGCNYSNETETSLTINSKKIDLVVLEHESSYLETSYNWESNLKQRSKIDYSSTFSTSPNVGTTIWSVSQNSKRNLLSTVLEASIRKKKNSDDSTPYIIYTFNPNNYLVMAEFNDDIGNNFTLYLRDNGNGDPDIRKGDFIYTRYLITPSAKSRKIYSAKVVAKDFSNVVIGQIYLGTIYLPHLDETKFPPNRIGDLRVISEDSIAVIFDWTAPGGQYDHGSATAYYLYCHKELNTITFHNDALKSERNKLQKPPKESGSRENYSWTKYSFNTTCYCVMLSQNKYNIWSEISNIVVIYPISATPKLSSSDTILYGIGVVVAGIIVILLLTILIRHITKNKRKKETSPIKTYNESQVVNPSSTKKNKRIYENSQVITRKEYKDNLEMTSFPKIAKPAMQLPLCEDEYVMPEVSTSGNNQSQTMPLLSQSSGHHFYNAKSSSAIANQPEQDDVKFLKSKPVHETDFDENDDFSYDDGIIQPYAIYVPRIPINKPLR